MTEQQLMDIWAKIPPQGDPTGRKFAVAFGRAVLEAAEKQSQTQTEKE